MSRARDIADLSSVSARLDTVGGSEGALSNRNLIINGGMQCWQRASAATTVVNNSYQTVDRFFFYEDTDGSYTTEQSTGHRSDTGHDIALKCVCTGTDTSLAATQFASVSHRIEAQNLQHLKYGTSNAKTLTCSFWVRSSKTGIYSFSLAKNDATAHYFVSEYTINAADTWEHKTISIPVLTGSSITNDTGVGFSIEWALAYGSQFRTSTLDQWMTAADFASTNQVNWLDSTSNNWYLTGVQLEVGDTATDFEHRSFGDELLRCQRYYFHTYEPSTAIGTATGHGAIVHSFDGTQSYGRAMCFYPVEMRARPTTVAYNVNDGTANQVNGDSTNVGAAYGFQGHRSINVGVSNVSFGASVFLRYQLTADAEL